MNHYFDFEPLLIIARRRYAEQHPIHPFSDDRLAKMLRTNAIQIRRWKEQGIFFIQAEKTCEGVDLMPHEIWPEYWDVVDDYYKQVTVKKRRKAPA